MTRRLLVVCTALGAVAVSMGNRVFAWTVLGRPSAVRVARAALSEFR